MAPRPAKELSHKVTPLNVRIYSDGQTATSQQSAFSAAVAICTLSLYTGWIHIILALVVASCWSKVALALLVALFSTLLLPARPLVRSPRRLHAWARVLCVHWMQGRAGHPRGRPQTLGLRIRDFFLPTRTRPCSGRRSARAGCSGAGANTSSKRQACRDQTQLPPAPPA
jgi:hypothetical protein